jgi:tryptophanyl-tRNA synthetase
LQAASTVLAGDEILVLPEPQIDERIMTIPGLDGLKMSKSYHNYIDIFLPENELKKVTKKSFQIRSPLKNPRIRKRHYI